MNHYNDIEADDYYDMADEWMRGREYDKAAECLKKAIDLNPNFIYAYITLAQVHTRRKKYHDANLILKKASKIDPSFDRLYFLMAKNNFKTGDLKGTLSYLDRAIDVSPKELYIRARELVMRKMKW